ncbi:hypothetical protein D3C72_595990 [compost metagenome]
MDRWLIGLHLGSVMALLAGALTLKALAWGGEGDQTREHAEMSEWVREAIASPAGMAVFATGLTLLTMKPGLFQQPWFWLKLAFVVGLLGVCRKELTPDWARAGRPSKDQVAAPRPAGAWRLSLVAMLVCLFGIAVAVLVRPFAG